MKHSELVKKITEQMRIMPKQKDLAQIIGKPVSTINSRASRDLRYNFEEVKKISAYYGIDFENTNELKKSSIGERLQQVRYKKNLTQTELGTILNISKQAVANIESGHNNPSAELLCKLIENLDVNSNWLLVGAGNMFNPPKFEDVKDEILKEVEKMLKQKGIS